MKRVSVILLVFVMIFSMAYAESIDLTGMSVEDLSDLRSAIDEELLKRDEAVFIPDGSYVVGLDISEGSYVLSQHSDDAWAVVWIYNSEESITALEKAENEYYTAMTEYRNSDDQSITMPEKITYSDYYTRYDLFDREEQRLRLKDGQVLKVSRARSGSGITPIVISKSEGLFMN
jgi:hypothetical protein